jgi:putative acetyltransferase
LNCPEILSLVAKNGETVVGHILFSPVVNVQNEGWTIQGMGLGPLAVLPEYQGQGIGSALCQAGMQHMAQANYPFVIVLGHPGYYPRFGFTKASAHGISSAFENVPDEAFMVCIFKPEDMQGVSGVAHYRPEFDEES